MATLAAVAATVPAAAAHAATFVGTPTSGPSPSFYLPRSAKAACRAHYTKQTVTLRKRSHGKLVKVRQVRCVLVKSTRGSGSGTSSSTSTRSAPTFPANLPVGAVTVSIIPTATDHSYVTIANTMLSVGGSGILAGATGSGLSAVLESGPAHGSLELARNGTFSYTPAPNASGVERFTYGLRNSWGATSLPATVTLDVDPIAYGAVYSIPAGETLTVGAGTLLGGDVGSDLTASLAGVPTDGTVSVASDGSFSYTPSAGFVGADSFSYDAVDSGSLQSDPATVTINVGAVPPTVVPQTFLGAVGNTPLRVGGSAGGGPEVYLAGQNALLGDSDPGGGTVSATPGAITTAEGGTVSMAANGTFTYQPPAGFRGPSDSFTYQVDTSEDTNATATATIDFTNARVWYLDSSAAPGGSGTSTSPLRSLADLSGHASTGDVIFLAGTGTYGGGLTMQSGQVLVGGGANLVAGGETLLSGSGSGATLSGGLALADGVKVAGLAVSGTVTASNVNGFTIDPTASISNAAGDALDITGGSGTDTIGAAITATGGHSVSIQSSPATVALNGTVTDNGTGILLANDTGGTVSFAGQIVASTGSATAFAATGGGTVTATSAASTLSTTTATALDVSGVAIGTDGLTFASVSAGTGTAPGGGPANGVLVDSTSVDGGLQIDGGAIQNTTGAAVAVTSAGSLTLAGMAVSGSGGDGIDITSSGASSVLIAHLSGNTIGAAGTGIDAQALSGATLDLTLGGNTIAASGASHNGVTVTRDAGDDAGTVCVDPTAGNAVNAVGSGGVGMAAIDQPSGGAGQFQIANLTGSVTDMTNVESFLGTTLLAGTVQSAFASSPSGFLSVAKCPPIIHAT